MIPANTTVAKGKGNEYRPNQASPVISANNWFPEHAEQYIANHHKHHCHGCPLSDPVTPTTQ
jgi:hypothetical protein